LCKTLIAHDLIRSIYKDPRDGAVAGPGAAATRAAAGARSPGFSVDAIEQAMRDADDIH
jgi:hypothetical protein